MKHSWQGFVLVAVVAWVTATLVGCDAGMGRMGPADAKVHEEDPEGPDDPMAPPDAPSDGTTDAGPDEVPRESPFDPPPEEASDPGEVSPPDPPEGFPPRSPVASEGDPREPVSPAYPPSPWDRDPGEPRFTEHPPLEGPRKGDPSEPYRHWPDPVSDSGDGGEHVGPRPSPALRPSEPVERPHYPPPVDPPPSHLTRQPRVPVAGGPDAGMAAQVPPSPVQPLPAHPDTDRRLRINPLRRGDLPVAMTPRSVEAAPRATGGQPEHVAVQPADPRVFRRPPVPPGGSTDPGAGSTTLPPETRPPFPIVPAPFGPGESPPFAPAVREPYRPAEQPRLNPETVDAANRFLAENEPHAMTRETLRPEAAELQPEPAEPAHELSAPDEVASATESAEEKAERDPKEDENFHRVTVYYGTDRANLTEIERSQLEYLTWLKWAGLALTATMGAAVIQWRIGGGYFLKFLLVVCLLSTVGLAGWSAVRWLQAIPPELQPQYAYGGKSGSLKYGTCDVSIPKKHQRGKLESPSLIWGEFQADPEKHVKVLDSQELGEAKFFGQLRECVTDSKKKQAFVFIHGYNVSFDDAVRRTAQLAFDLEFDGAPICYSWPSQANTFYYATDAETVVDTEDHLHSFLVGIQNKSGAKKIHLIAHSMGNRCLTAVLRDMARDLEDDKPPFDEIVLTAPDVRASTFRRRAPDIVKMANRVTLYASSNDQALKISKEIQTFPRAGETGTDEDGKDKIVVVPGIDTIDVSTVDTSLLGHTYYGDNISVLSDLFHVIQFGRPAVDRNWLKPKPFEDSRYWILLTERIGGRPGRESR